MIWLIRLVLIKQKTWGWEVILLCYTFIIRLQSITVFMFIVRKLLVSCMGLNVLFCSYALFKSKGKWLWSSVICVSFSHSFNPFLILPCTDESSGALTGAAVAAIVLACGVMISIVIIIIQCIYMKKPQKGLCTPCRCGIKMRVPIMFTTFACFLQNVIECQNE